MGPVFELNQNQYYMYLENMLVSKQIELKKILLWFSYNSYLNIVLLIAIQLTNNVMTVLTSLK